MLLAGPALALDKDKQDALKNTQALLASPEAMKAFAKDNADASRALEQTNQITKGNKAQNAEITDISSSVFADMVKQNDGDAAAMQEKLQNALKDPAAFIKTLSPQQQERIRSLASEMEKQNKESQAPAAPTTK